MAELTEYKCPACGGAMEFDSKSQKMKCPYCDTVMDMEEYERIQKEQKEQEIKAQQEEGGWLPGETDQMRVYVCNSCGGEIIADENTGATMCPYCGNKVTMKGQFSGDLRPDYVIPFKKDKKDAKNAYLKHLEGKKFLPKCFRAQNHIDEIKGVYVPFWIYNFDADANMTYDARQVRVWTSGDREYTETRYYDVHRSGEICFEHIPVDSSTKMDDTLMESIEPFDFKDAVDFKAAYLAGYLADRYDVSVDDNLARAKERAKSSAEITFRETVKGYSSVTTKNSSMHVNESSYKYTLYPVWVLNTTWKGKNYIFAMNGQTGKLTGDLPVDEKAYWTTLIGIGTVLSVVIVALTYLFF